MNPSKDSFFFDSTGCFLSIIIYTYRIKATLSCEQRLLTMFKLSRDSGMPLYLQAENAVRHFIQAEGLGKGERLPSLEILADRFGIARLTMRQAIKRLEKEGVLASGRGKGIVVLQEPKTPPKMRVKADFHEFMRLSRTSFIKTLREEDVAGCPLVRDAGRDTAFRHWIRVHSDSGVAYGFLDLYLDKRVYDEAPERFDAEPTMHVTTELPSLAGAVYRQRLTVGTALATEAEHLNITPGTPVAHVLRTGRTGGGDLFFAATVVYPGNQLVIDMDLNLPPPGRVNRA